MSLEIHTVELLLCICLNYFSVVLQIKLSCILFPSPYCMWCINVYVAFPEVICVWYKHGADRYYIVVCHLHCTLGLWFVILQHQVYIVMFEFPCNVHSLRLLRIFTGCMPISSSYQPKQIFWLSSKLLFMYYEAPFVIFFLFLCPSVVWVM